MKSKNSLELSTLNSLDSPLKMYIYTVTWLCEVHHFSKRTGHFFWHWCYCILHIVTTAIIMSTNIKHNCISIVSHNHKTHNTSLQSVSYTHLDVYKRQVWFEILWRSVMCFILVRDNCNTIVFYINWHFYFVWTIFIWLVVRDSAVNYELFNCCLLYTSRCV